MWVLTLAKARGSYKHHFAKEPRIKAQIIRVFIESRLLSMPFCLALDPDLLQTSVSSSLTLSTPFHQVRSVSFPETYRRTTIQNRKHTLPGGCYECEWSGVNFQMAHTGKTVYVCRCTQWDTLQRKALSVYVFRTVCGLKWFIWSLQTDENKDSWPLTPSQPTRKRGWEKTLHDIKRNTDGGSTLIWKPHLRMKITPEGESEHKGSPKDNIHGRTYMGHKT